MKNLPLKILSMLMAGVVITSCEAIGGIFKAGMYTGILVVLLMIGAIIVVIARLRRKKIE